MRLIADWRSKVFKLWSVRAYALFAALGAVLVANQGLLLGLMNFVPDRLKPLAALVTFFVTFGVPTWARLAHQPKLEKPDGQ